LGGEGGLGDGTVKRRIFLRIAKMPEVVAVGVVGVRSGSVSDELPSIALFSLFPSGFMAAMSKEIESGMTSAALFSQQVGTSCGWGAEHWGTPTIVIPKDSAFGK
jgi:hypothetical protein